MSWSEQNAKTLQALIEAEMGRPCLHCGPDARPPGRGSCLHLEEIRKPSQAERVSLGWARRPYSAYKVEQLCDSCAVLWHLNMAQQALFRLERSRLIDQAQQQRGGAV